MRRSKMRFVVGLLMAVAVRTPAAAEGPLAILREKYLDGLFRAKPHLGSYMGDRRCDGKLPDFSAAALERRREELNAQKKELEGIPRAGFSQKTFNEGLVGHTTVGVKYLRRYLLPR